MSEIITSLQNPRIKNIVNLEKTAERKEHNLTKIEGLREFFIALEAGIEVKTIFICPEIIDEKSKSKIEKAIPNSNIVYITKAVFEKVAYRENSDGIIALVTPRELKFSQVKLSTNPLIIILESVEKPGNLGAILRTADAAKVDAVIVCDPKTDTYNPNTIRSSVGCIFTNQVVVCNIEEAIEWLKNNHIHSYAAALTAKKYYHESDLSGAVAFVMGTEAVGLSEKWLKGADEQIKIPMSGKIDSLNVSTSCAILVFEAMRQRGFNH